MESDLDFIGASRAGPDHRRADPPRPPAAAGMDRPLARSDSAGPSTSCPSYLASEIPYLANRGGEALRALVTACVLDHDDIATLAFSIEGLKRVMAYAADACTLDGKACRPACPIRSSTCASSGIPWPSVRRPASPTCSSCLASRPTTRPSGGGSSATSAAIAGPSAAGSRSCWGRGATTPGPTVQARMRDVLLRTDLWSDQILVLRAVQTLTMLDVQHNCELVWSLGGYSRRPPSPIRATITPVPRRRRATPARRARASPPRRRIRRAMARGTPPDRRRFRRGRSGRDLAGTHGHGLGRPGHPRRRGHLADADARCMSRKLRCNLSFSSPRRSESRSSDRLSFGLLLITATL